MTELERMKELVAILNPARKAYYAEGREIMSNKEYDQLYDELEALEQETGMVLAGSPTQEVGYEVVTELPKRTHPEPMLSLSKTKEVGELSDWLGDHEGVISWKMDGLTVVLTYENGSLMEAVTRGNGEVGELITANARTFVNIPLRIPFQGRLVLRGEALIPYSEFEKINATIEDADAKYKNPRNLCSGSVRQLDSQITAERHVSFYAFTLVEAAGQTFDTIIESFRFLSGQGFDVVEYKQLENGAAIPDAVKYFAETIAKMDLPSDGLVLSYNNLAYGRSLGRTAKAPRHSIAFKWKDETAVTSFRYIHWSPSRTGLINPVAVFDPVELEGTTVSRASVHNVSILEGLQLGSGDQITVYKANMIIPQIDENLTRSGMDPLPEVCPICGGRTEVRNEDGVKTLHCINPDCAAKHVKQFALMADREGLNIDGLSEATIEKMMDAGILHQWTDLFHLAAHAEVFIQMEGFGQKSFDKLLQAVEKARHTRMPNYIYSLGVAGIGLANAKMLWKAFAGRGWKALEDATAEDLVTVDGIGEVLAAGWVAYFADEARRQQADALYDCLIFEEEPEDTAQQSLAGGIYVITGSVEHFPNRDAMKEFIESKGGKVTGSVTGKTTALINNDITSTSGKNKKAKELGVEIISEDELLRRAGNAN